MTNEEATYDVALIPKRTAKLEWCAISGACGLLRNNPARSVEMKYKPVVTFCPMAQYHLNEVINIEQRTFDEPWEPLDFYIARKNPNGGVLIAERREQVIGYCAYAIQNRKITILNLAVDCDYRNQGVGSSLVDSAKHSMVSGTRRVTAIIRESNLDAQLFFQSQGFRALGVLPNYYGSNEDAYRFTWCHWGAG